jgi:ketosteroid isomerase-like protein
MPSSVAWRSRSLLGSTLTSERFLRVFADFDSEPFRASWSSEPIVFFPFDDTPETVTGAAAVASRFERFFQEVRARAPGPPYLHIKQRELIVEGFGDVGLVTFVLDQPPQLGGPPIARRTLLFVKENGVWKLAHLHASAAGRQ